MRYGKLEGKVAVVTGSSRGIGKAIAAELARNGAWVVMNGRHPGRLKEAEAEIREISGHVIGFCSDVSTIEGSCNLIGETIRLYGKIDILINNVGISMRGRIADLNPEVFDTIFRSNVFGAVYPVIAAIKHLKKVHGSIVFISSLAGVRGLPFISAYSSSKMALRAVAESIRIEEKGLHVGVVYVGYTENDINKEAVASDGSKVILEPRQGKGVASKESVAKAVVRNIKKRKFITVLTFQGKMMALIQPLFPGVVERIIRSNLEKFRERGK
jgi:NAD(P)-dependent dehydrogenase (short-subunit alcohol dehydrogenase family)